MSECYYNICTSVVSVSAYNESPFAPPPFFSRRLKHPCLAATAAPTASNTPSNNTICAHKVIPLNLGRAPNLTCSTTAKDICEETHSDGCRGVPVISGMPVVNVLLCRWKASWVTSLHRLLWAGPINCCTGICFENGRGRQLVLPIRNRRCHPISIWVDCAKRIANRSVLVVGRNNDGVRESVVRMLVGACKRWLAAAVPYVTTAVTVTGSAVD